MRAKTDDRMGWIRNLEAIAKGCADSRPTEFEFASDTYIPGLLSYADGAILCGTLSAERSPSGLHLYALRAALAELSPWAPPLPHATKTGYAFRAGVPGELLALFSLYLHARFYLTAVNYGELTSTGLKMRYEYPYLHRPCPPDIDPVLLMQRSRNFAIGLDRFLDQVRRLPPRYHQRFVLSCHHFARALREVGIDTEMVFIRLVSAVEAVYSDTKLPKADDVFSGVVFDDIVRLERLPAEARDELRGRAIITRHLCAE